MNQHPLVRRARRQLLASIPALLLVLPASAFAQSTGITSDGRTTVTNDQRAESSVVRGTLANPPATIRTTTLTDSQARIAGNAASTTARANDAQSELASDPNAVFAWPARVTIESGIVSGEASNLILSNQSMRDAEAIAKALYSGYSLDIGQADTSQATLEANVQSATARGNDHLATLSDTNGSGATVVTVQRGDARSAVRSRVGGATSLTVQDANNSASRLDQNRQQSFASGNGADLALSVSSPGETAVDGDDATTVLSGADVGVSAGSAVVAQQTWSGPATARIGALDRPAGFVSVAGTLIGSTTSADTNVLAAAVLANKAVTDHRTAAAQVSDHGTVATTLTVQDTSGPVSAAIVGGVQSHVPGTVDHSTMSVSANDVSTSATGNAADNFLGGHAGIITGSIEGGWQMPGSGWVSPDAMTGTSGTYTIHTEQLAGGAGVSASVLQGSSNIGVEGPIFGSQVLANGNRQGADAVANDAKALLDLAGSSFGGSAVTSLVQSNDAGVGSYFGGGDDFGGATIAPAGPTQDSRIEIRDNLIETQSVGNRGTNGLNLSVSDLVSTPNVIGRGLSASRAGSVDNGFGVSATAALSSVQKTGQLGNAPLIASEIQGRFSVTGDGPTEGTTTLISGNRQQAEAMANSVDNALSLSAANRDGAGTALYSAQYGEAAVRAVSSMRVVAHGALENSTSTISGNTNLSAATMNDATSRLQVDAAGTSGGGLAILRADPLGNATGEADDVLVSTQFATGSVAATATTMLAGSGGSASLGATGPTQSQFQISGNLTGAQATGNQAVNTAVLNANASGGIATSQMNIASATASASAPALLEVPTVDRAILASDITVSDNISSALARGNVAENVITVDRLSSPGAASIEVGRFQTSVEAPVALVSVQTSYGAISASADGPIAGVPLNGGGVPMEASRIAASGNQVSAAAYGNGVTNTVVPTVGSMAGVALVNAQTNYGPITARVTAPTASISQRDVAGSSLGIVNNTVSASATGNLATNVVGILR